MLTITFNPTLHLITLLKLKKEKVPIYKTKAGYKIKNTKGVSKTRKQALKRLRAIKVRQKKV
jgi:hypothetical protein